LGEEMLSPFALHLAPPHLDGAISRAGEDEAVEPGHDGVHGVVVGGD